MASAGPDRRQLGQDAEDAALAYLQARGLQLLARNVRYPFGELDLIVGDGAAVAFVEVRFRSNSQFGGAIMSVNASKRRKLARAAQAWLKSRREFSNAACRFDVVAVAAVSGKLQCEWIPSAFTLDDLW